MQKYPHKPKDADLQELLVDFRERYQSTEVDPSTVSREQNWALLDAAWTTAIELSCLEYAFDASSDLVRSLWTNACRRGDRIIQLGRMSGTGSFRINLALSHLVDQASLREKLETIDRPTLVNPDLICDELDYLSTEIMGDLSAGREDSANRRLALAEKRAAAKSLKPLFRDMFLPLLRMEAAIVRRDSSALDAAVQDRINSHQRRHSSSMMRSLPSSLLDYVGLGMLKIAQGYGLKTSVISVYLPAEYF